MRERVYASTGDYANHTGSPAPDDLDRRLLARCSRRIDRELIGCIYATDERGYPTDPDVRQLLREATCAQAAWCYGRGDKLGTGTPADEWTNVKIGDVALSKGNSDSGGGDRRMPLAPEAADILQSEGMLPIMPTVFG